MFIMVMAITSCGKHATKGAGEGVTIGAASSGYLGTVYLMICGLAFLKVRFVLFSLCPAHLLNVACVV